MNDSPGHACHDENGGPGAEPSLRDPVCGMSVTSDSDHRHVHGGETYYFCSAHCLRKFEASPVQYLERHSTHDVPASSSASAGVSDSAYVCPMCPEVRELAPGACPSCGMALEPETPTLPTKTQYTCPMHPEVVRDEPGDCPICGMALEPMTVTVDEEENPELADMTRRLRRERGAGGAAGGHRHGRGGRPLVRLARPRRVRSAGWSSLSARPWCCGAAGRSS